MAIVVYALIILIILEIIGLLYLYFSVRFFAAYWNNRQQNNGELLYIALGDSAAQSIGASHPNAGYVGIIAKKLQRETGKKIKVINVSVTGAKISDVIEKQLPMIASLSPDFVTIEIGANNIGSFNKDSFATEFSELIKLLPTGTYVSNMPYFGSRPKLTPVAMQATAIINELVTANKNVTLVDLQEITKRKHTYFGYAADFFHPNNIAYKNWEKAFWDKIEPTLDNTTK
jgi:lysophospholipase L1-like esterase